MTKTDTTPVPGPAIERSDSGDLRGSNQSGIRAHNERLVLSLVRREKALAKSDIARITGLSLQTVSVIMRALEADGLLKREEPIRGRIGQPSVPMSLNPEGAVFFGLKIGRRSVDLILTDFLGRIIAQRRRIYRYPTHATVVDFAARELPSMIDEMPTRLRARIGGLGIAMPGQLWNWAQYLGAPQAEMDDWRARDIRAEIAGFCQFPVFVQNDATAACGAELVFGTGPRPKDFLYFFIAYFVGGGLVLNGQLYAGRTGNAAALGSMPVPGPGGRMRQLISVASMSSLESYLAAEGEDFDGLWDTPPDWTMPAPILDRWIAEAAAGLAHATLAAATVVDIEAALIDGWMPTEVRARLAERIRIDLAGLNTAGIEPPRIAEGTVGAQARSLGAASIPLSQRYLVDQNAFLKDG